MVPENSTEKWYQILLINPDASLFANRRIGLETAYMTLINELCFVFCGRVAKKIPNFKKK